MNDHNELQILLEIVSHPLIILMFASIGIVAIAKIINHFAKISISSRDKAFLIGLASIIFLMIAVTAMIKKFPPSSEKGFEYNLFMGSFTLFGTLAVPILFWELYCLAKGKNSIFFSNRK